jgi:1,4-alpha-glucan branching enzyme
MAKVIIRAKAPGCRGRRGLSQKRPQGRIAAMLQKARKKGYVKFSVLPAEGSKAVALVGDFNNWQPVEMKKQKDGRFAVEVKLPAGQYQYKFIIDGQWAADQENGDVLPNPHGSLNSVAKVS